MADKATIEKEVCQKLLELARVVGSACHEFSARLNALVSAELPPVTGNNCDVRPDAVVEGDGLIDNAVEKAYENGRRNAFNKAAALLSAEQIKWDSAFGSDDPDSLIASVHKAYGDCARNWSEHFRQLAAHEEAAT